MSRNQSGSATRKRLTFFLAVSGIVLAGLAFYFGWQRSERKPVTQLEEPEFAAELVSAEGMVLVRKPGRSEWREVNTGARLMEGDLLQTDFSGEACIRYKGGSTVFVQSNTIFTIRSAEESKTEISVSPQEAIFAFSPADRGAPEQEKPKKSENRDGASLHSINIERIVPFGRSLELIGKVEAGSSLRVNDEAVEIAGDGSFKHFTKPFRGSDQTVPLVLELTDLAGRTRTMEFTHDFRPHGGGKQ